MRFRHCWLVGMCALATAGSAGAAGFELGEQGARPLGTALAGIGTGTEELSAAFWNPAGMAADPRPGVGAGGSLISPSMEFSGDTPDGGDAGRDGYPPHVFARDHFGEGWTGGFALTVPFGLRTKWDEDWAGRYHAVTSDLNVTQGTLSLAKSVGSLSLGGGFVIQQLDVELTNKIKTPAPAADGDSRIKGDSHGYGWMAGALWESGGTRLGLSYHSSVVHDIGGTQVVDLRSIGGGFNRLSVSARLDLPARAIAGVRQELGERWRAMASVQWTEWSNYDELFVDAPGTAFDTTREKDWEDSWSVAVGTEYDLSDAWTVRGGYRFEQTPVPDKEHRDPRLPDSDRQRFGVGAGYAWGAGWSADVAYNYMQFADAKIDNSDSAAAGGATPETLSGSFDSSAHIVDIQVSKRF